MNTVLWIVCGIVAYLFVAWLIYEHTTPPLYDDSQLSRMLKLIVLTPVFVVITVVFAILMIGAEYWEYLQEKKRSRGVMGSDAAQMEGSFRQ